MDFNMSQHSQPTRRPTKPPEAPAPLYACSEPYPPIKVEQPNPHYAQILKNSLASSKSETTAVMHHLQMLGRLIDLLGGTPSYCCVQRNRQFPWNATMVFYGRMVRQMMQNNIAGEQEAIRQYRKQIQIIQDCHIQEIIKRIILDEELHIELFKKYL